MSVRLVFGPAHEIYVYMLPPAVHAAGVFYAATHCLNTVSLCKQGGLSYICGMRLPFNKS